MLLKSLKLISTHLKWVFNFLLYHPFYNIHGQYCHEFPGITEEEEEEEEVKIWHPHEEEEEEEERDCAVCLSKIGEGDDVRMLRCEHIFHRVCLDEWIAFKNSTCPLCRDFLGSRRSEVGGLQVLFFKFCSFASNSDERDNWWLR